MTSQAQPGGRAAAPPPLDLVQDFVNTEIPEWQRDDLATPALLTSWLRAGGLLDDREHADERVYVAARALREALRALALSNTIGFPLEGDARSRVDEALGLIHVVPAASATGIQVVPAGSAGERALGAIVVRVLDAEREGCWRRMKACRKDSCGWLFYDGSRNRSSSWCSMSICGNRVKAREARRRRAPGRAL